ncbi:M20 family metallopeptidase [Rothia halotolerans]|uniref:M20 family metallopeptidase n=1 Tax=Rothia halotolerans TaxID=405770 RepID=UPI00101CCF07|nr:M20 family metallopeptidase [Rothia halotolerans]
MTPDTPPPGFPARNAAPDPVPAPPSRAYLDIMAAQSRRLLETSSYVPAEREDAPEELYDRLERAVEDQREELVDILHDLHRHPEEAFREVHAADRLLAHLEARGLVPQRPAFGLETAVHAVVESPGFDPGRHRTVAVLSEYDALPGIGHGCGHNVIAAAGLGAFTALAGLLREGAGGLEGRAVYYGTPAEEGEAGKELMARAGAFAEADAAIMLHPYFADVADQAWLGRRVMRAVFSGVAAHASSHPFMGRNALDAAVLAYQGVGLLRQQTPPTDRLHAILPEGGERPSIITESATLKMYVRSRDPETLKALSARVEEVMGGAALMAGVGVEVRWDESPATLPVRTNGPLTDRWVLAQRRRGRDPLPRGTLSEALAASTDFGNLSFRLPGIHPLIGIAGEDVALHTREFAAAAGSPAAESAAVDGAYGLAATALDFLHDDALAEAVRTDFEERGGAVDVEHYFD